MRPGCCGASAPGTRSASRPTLETVAADLDVIEQSVAIEAWQGGPARTAADLGVADWLDRAERQADRLAANAGPHAAGLRQHAQTRIGQWRARL